MKKIGKIVRTGALAVCLGGAVYRWNIRMPLREYTRQALYMAVLDDEICRGELEGMRFSGKTVAFPSRDRSLQDRYHLFLEMNRKKSRGKLRAEIRVMEHRLALLREQAEKKEKPTDRVS